MLIADTNRNKIHPLAKPFSFVDGNSGRPAILRKCFLTCCVFIRRF